MEIILIRSAESIAHTEGKYQGQTYDTDLSEQGVKQAEALAKLLGERFTKVDAIYSSPLKRAVQTAELVAKGLLVGEPVVDKRLSEMDRGLWDGMQVEVVRERFEEIYRSYVNDPETTGMPDGETVVEMRDRVWDFWKYLESLNLDRVVVVSHDITIRVTVTKLLRRNLRDMWIFGLDNAGYSLVEWGIHPQVVSLNVDEHLEKIRSDLESQAL